MPPSFLKRETELTSTVYCINYCLDLPKPHKENYILIWIPEKLHTMAPHIIYNFVSIIVRRKGRGGWWCRQCGVRLRTTIAHSFARVCPLTALRRCVPCTRNLWYAHVDNLQASPSGGSSRNVIINYFHCTTFLYPFRKQYSNTVTTNDRDYLPTSTNNSFNESELNNWLRIIYM